MSSSRIPSLDGIRSVAVIFVLVAHCSGTRYFSFSESTSQLLDVGNLGVRIFFVLSGFLISTLLLHEHEKYGSISLKNFYMRRTIRIFPAFYFFVACIALIDALGFLQLYSLDILHSLTYTINYHYHRSWEVGHLWSLAVEEQFYLLWPLTLMFLGIRRGLLFALFVFILVPLVRVLTWQYFPSQRIGIGESFQTVCDALATGCLLAGTRYYLGEIKFFGYRLRGLGAAVLSVLVLTLNYFIDHISVSYTVGITIMNVSIALLIDWAICNPNSRVGYVLNSRLFVYVGTLSYSLYLWQQLFLNRNSDSLLCVFPLNIILVCVAAIFSYHLVEKPFLNLRSRYRLKNQTNS